MSFLYRNLSPRFQSLYATAFTENSFPSNEKGLYLGLTVRPATTLRLDAYVDFFQFPWLKYGVNAPSGGKDYLLQFTCQPNKQVELYTRFHVEEKTVNDNPAAVVLLPVVPQKHINWRTQFSYTVSRRVALRSRAEINWIDPRSAKKEQGFLIYADFIQRHLFKSLSGNLRVQYFETGSYLGRIYAYENDVMFTYSIPVFYDKGLKYYVNINYDIKRQFSLWLKWSQMFYPAKSYIGSGLDEIKGSRKSEIRIELVKDF
jgi:hypothetical protein